MRLNYTIPGGNILITQIPRVENKSARRYQAQTAKEVCYDPIPHGSHGILHILGTDTLRAFVLDYLFKDVCIRNNLGRQS